MIVNLYVDHLMQTPPTSAEEVWSATRDHPKVFSEAANRIGMTPAEYTEFRANLLAGKAVYVKLPRQVDAMSGDRRGSIYAVKNAVMNKSIMGWRVQLADGNLVYVPQICGNISFTHHAVIAYHEHKKPHHYLPYKPTIGTPVVVTPTTPDLPADTPPTVAQVVPAAAAANGLSPFLLAIPAAIGGIVAGVTGGHSPAPPPCSGGSTEANVCSK